MTTTVPTTSATSAAPGWYPDPQGAGRRFWDGARWTADVLPGAPPPPPPAGNMVPPPPVGPATSWAPAPGATRRGRATVLATAFGGAALTVVSSVMTWATGTVNGVPVSKAHGLDGTAPWLFGGPSSRELAEAMAFGTPVTGVSDIYLLLTLVAASFGLLWLAQRDRRDGFAYTSIGLAMFAMVMTFIELGSFYGRAEELTELLGADVGITYGPGPTAFLVGCVVIIVSAIRHLRGAR